MRTKDHVLESIEEHHVVVGMLSELEELGERLAAAKADAPGDPLALSSASPESSGSRRSAMPGGPARLFAAGSPHFFFRYEG